MHDLAGRHHCRFALAVLGVAAAVPGSAQSMVSNGGFEAGAEGWSLPAPLYSVDTSVAHGGGASLRYTNTPGGPYLLASQSLPLVPGKHYRMSVWIKTDGVASTDTGAAICLEWQGEDGYIGGSYPPGFVGSGEWRQLVFETGPVPPEATSGSVTVYGRPGTTGTAWFDDVEVVELEAPIARIGLAGRFDGQRQAVAWDWLGEDPVAIRAELTAQRGARAEDYRLVVRLSSVGQTRELSTEQWNHGAAQVSIPATELFFGHTIAEVLLVSRETGAPIAGDSLTLLRRPFVQLAMAGPNAGGVVGLSSGDKDHATIRVSVARQDPQAVQSYSAHLRLLAGGAPAGEPVVLTVTDLEPARVDVPMAGVTPGLYDIECTVLKPGGDEPLARASIAVTKADAALRPASATGFGPSRMLMVGDKPFFPIGFYILSSLERIPPVGEPWKWLTGRLAPEYYLPVLDRLSASHFNCFIDYGSTLGGVEQARQVLDAAHARSLKVIFSVKDLMQGAFWDAYTSQLPWKDLGEATRNVVQQLREHPALVAWYINDEVCRPDLWPGAVDVFRNVRAADPWHPTYAVHYDYQGLGVYRQACDAIGTDPYVLLGDIGAAATNWHTCRELIGPEQPFWAVVQCFGPGYEASIPGQTAEPSFDEERAATMAAIAEGATGIIYYCMHSLQRSPRFEERFSELDRIAAEVQALVPIVALPDAPTQATVEQGTLSALTKQGEGRAYVILASTRREDQDAVLRLPPATQTVRDVSTGEQLQVEGARLGLRFRALDARVLELHGP